MSLVGAVLVTGCGAGTPAPVPKTNAVAGVTPVGVAGETAAATGAQDEWQAVRLDEIAVDRSDPESEVRNPFRFGAPRTSVAQFGPGGGDGPGPRVAPVPGGGPTDLDSVPAPRGAASPGGPGDVPLTFIGFVESPGIAGRVVVLTDGELVFHGRVGDVIDGRYRIVGLGLESVDMERIDGRGQQTLRLSGEPVEPEPALPPPSAQPQTPPARPDVSPAAQVLVTPPGAPFRVGGGPYTVPVSISGVSQLSTISLTLFFDPNVLRVRTVQEGSFMRQGGVQVTFRQQVDTAGGRIDITATRMNDAFGAAGAGLLAAVLFEAVGPGSVTLSTSGTAMTPGGAPLMLQFTPGTVTAQ